MNNIPRTGHLNKIPTIPNKGGFQQLGMRVNMNQSNQVLSEIKTSLQAVQVFNALSELTNKSGYKWAEQTSRGDGELRENKKGEPHNLKGTDFGKWVMSEDAAPPSEGTMSCYEAILLAAVNQGALTKQYLVKHYNMQTICKWLDEDVCSETIVMNLDNSFNVNKLKPGDLILFGSNDRESEKERSPSTNGHVVMAVGNKKGPIEVISHHRNYGPPAKMTLDQLLKEMPHLQGEVMAFSSPNWMGNAPDK